MSRQGLSDQREGPHVNFFCVPLTWGGEFQPTVAPERGDKAATSLVCVVIIDVREVLRRPRFQPAGQFAMVRFEKRPVQKAYVTHRSVSGKTRSAFGNESFVGAPEIGS